LTTNLAGTAADQTLTFSYNPASQIITRIESWTPGPGGWIGITFGIGLGLPGIAYERTNFRLVHQFSTSVVT
jgi:hypothetical protein